MKDLDKAINNNDIEKIVFLFEQNIDFTGAVLMHIQDELLAAGLPEEALVARGAILSMAELQNSFAEYKEKSNYDYRYETYIKRLYLGLQKAYDSWKKGEINNPPLDNEWNKLAIEFLSMQMVKNALPESLQEFATEKQEEYIELKYQLWQSQALSNDESSILDQMLCDSLHTHIKDNVGVSDINTENFWGNALPEDNTVASQLRSNSIDQILEYYITAEDENFIRYFDKFVVDLMRGGKVCEGINYALNAEKEALLNGEIVLVQTPYYIQALKNLLSKFRGNQLDNTLGMRDEFTHYLKDNLQDFQPPALLKANLEQHAIMQLLQQYKDDGLPVGLMENLQQQFADNIQSFYVNSANANTDFRSELTNVIFSDLLESWKSQQLTPEMAKYLESNLLVCVQDLMQNLRSCVSHSDMSEQLKVTQDKVLQLTTEVQALRVKDGGQSRELIELKSDVQVLKEQAKTFVSMENLLRDLCALIELDGSHDTSSNLAGIQESASRLMQVGLFGQTPAAHYPAQFQSIEDEAKDEKPSDINDEYAREGFAQSS